MSAQKEGVPMGARRVCFVGSDDSWGLKWMTACGRYRRSVPSSIRNYVAQEVTDVPVEVNCRACWRTRFWRDAIGLTQAKNYALKIKHVRAPSRDSEVAVPKNRVGGGET